MQHPSDGLDDLATENRALRQRIATLEADLAARGEQARPSADRAVSLPGLDKLFTVVLEQLPAGVSIAASPSGELLFHNSEAVRLLRHPLLPTADYRGYAQYGALHPDGRPYAPEEYPIARALLGETSIPPEDMRYRRGDGTLTTLSVNAAPIRDAEGQIVAVVSTFHDVAAQRENDTALREREQQLTSVLESIDGRIWSVDRELRLLMGNSHFHHDVRALTGREVRAGESIWALPMSEERRDTWQASYDRALAGEAFNIEQQTVGQTVAYRFMPIRTNEGAIAGVTVFGLDITTRIRAESARQETERKLGTLFEILPVGVSILDAERKVVYANPAFNQILQLNTEVLAQSNYRQRQYLRPDGTPMPADEFASVQAFREQRPITNVETGIVTETGETIWTSVSAVPVNFPDWRVVVVTADTTAHKRAEQAFQRSTERLEILAGASRVFAETSSDNQALLHQVARVTAETLRAACNIRLLSDDGQWLELVVAKHFDPDAQAAMQAVLAPWRIHIEESSPVPLAVRRGEPQLVPVIDRAALRATLPPERQDILEGSTHSMIVLPLRLHGRSIGSMMLARTATELAPFNEDDLRLAQDLADRAALAIHNARLFQQVQNELAERQRAEQAMRASEAKLRAVFNALVEGVVFLNPQGQVEEANDAIQRFHGHTLAELADPETDPRQKIIRADGSLFPEEEQPAIVALRTNQSVRDVEMGVPAGDGSFRWRIVNAQPVNDSDGTLLGAVASFFDITERKRAEQALRRSTERLEILAEASRVFAEAGSEYDTVLSRVAHTLVSLMGDGCIIALISDDGAWLETSHVYDVEPDVQELTRSLLSGRRRIEESTTNARVFQTGQPLLVPLVDRDLIRAAAKPEYAAMIERQAYHSLIVVPMRAFGRVISVLTLYRRQSERPSFNADDLNLAQDLADRAALAIGNARLLEQVQRELTGRERAQRITNLLHVAGQLLARPLSLDQVLETLLDVLQQLIPYDSANIMLPDDAASFRVRYQHGYETWTDPEHVRALRFDLAERPPIARIVQTRRSLLIGDTHQEPTWKPMLGIDHIGCWLGVPLVANNKLVGIYSIDRHEPNSLSVDDVQLAETLAASAAVAIERAQLIEQLRYERAQLARRVEERTADLSLANAELARAARLKDEFLASMSHELRTPLNGILGRSEALQEEIYGPVTPKQIAALQSVTESGQHLLALINDILDLAKVEAGQLTLERETLDIDTLCTVSMRMVAQIAMTKQISLNTSTDPAAELINADERRLKQILVNLLSNAVKFTPRGGKIGLEVRSDVERQQVMFTVWDTGIGISEEDLAKLFQPFTQIDNRLNREHDGTGLGLALVRRLAEAHGGSVRVESVVGQGSRFSVILPWDPTEQRAVRLARASVVDTTQPAIRQALVIEDSTTVAAQLSRYLQELGAHVELSSYGTGTIGRAINSQPDVIILDILLPDEDGWQLLRGLKSEPRTREIPVIVVSVVDTPVHARELGAAEVLLKPIDREMFVAALRRATTRTAKPLVEHALVAVPEQTLRPRVLLAEDNQTNIDALFDYLRLKGYDVTVARNGQEAIVRAQEEHPDIILMDIQMPGIDGLEAIRRIRADNTLVKTPIIAVTALALLGDRERCLAAGADEYIAKPVSLRLLIQTIESLRKQRAEEHSSTENDEATPIA